MENWTWGLSLIALTEGFHVSGVVFMALVLHNIGVRAESHTLGLRRLFAILTGLIGTVGLLLAILHGIEAGFWAAAYWWVDALASPEEAVLYSFDSITTLGASGLALPQHWRMLGALEAADGMLLFGISTAFMIHSAKRQEWHAVYVLNLVDGCIPSDMATAKFAQIEEERRLLYVAMTRAKEHLYLIQPLRFFRTQQHRFGNGHIIAPRSRFLPDDMMKLFTRTVASIATLASDDLGPQAPVSVDIGAQLRGMWS